MTEIQEVNGEGKKNEIPMHYVCTIEEANELVEDHDRYWVMNCGCRKEFGKDNCKRSRNDVCLLFEEIKDCSWGSNVKELSKDEMDELMMHVEKSQLVVRPFRDDKTRSYTQGICFCCDCCCGYLRSEEDEVCDKGVFIEKTDMDACTHCGECVDMCFFNARKMEDGEHVIYGEKCYGCGLCVDVCPVNCIEMVER